MSDNAKCAECKYCGPFNIYRGDDGTEQILPPNAFAFGMQLFMRCKAPNTKERNPISQREAGNPYPCNNFVPK